MDYKQLDAVDTILENGLRVITLKKDTQIASIQCGIKVGALYEKADERGIAHFIEHMLFKGTHTRNNEKLNNDLEFLGGDYNAYTDYTSTVYSITALDEELERAAELMADMLINSTFPEEEMEKERDVILAEYNSSSDDIEDYSYRMVNFYGFKESPLKFDVIGTEETIKSFTREGITSFHNRYYLPNNAFLVIVSPMSHEEVLHITKKYFGCWKPAKPVRVDFIREKNVKRKKTTYKSNIEQSTIVYLYTFNDLPKERELALRILNHKLGESANSILFRELREKRGLAYDVYTHLDTSNDIKTIYIYTAVRDKYIKEAMETIDTCIEEFKSGKTSLEDEMLLLMKKVLKTAVASTLEDSTDLASYVLHQCLDGEEINKFIEDMKRIENISNTEIYNVAKEVFKDPTIHILKGRK
ncbi:MAG: pitrilysin family protein [Bacillota bacterium]|nr:pitrilysin family protein [Bacillota bacterium]